MSASIAESLLDPGPPWIRKTRAPEIMLDGLGSAVDGFDAGILSIATRLDSPLVHFVNTGVIRNQVMMSASPRSVALGDGADASTSLLH